MIEIMLVDLKVVLFSIYKLLNVFLVFCSELELEKNKVAGFISLLKNICVGHTINQELLHTTQGIATVAALLQKVRLMDLF